MATRLRDLARRRLLRARSFKMASPPLSPHRSLLSSPHTPTRTRTRPFRWTIVAWYVCYILFSFIFLLILVCCCTEYANMACRILALSLPTPWPHRMCSTISISIRSSTSPTKMAPDSTLALPRLAWKARARSEPIERHPISSRFKNVCGRIISLRGSLCSWTVSSGYAPPLSLLLCTSALFRSFDLLFYLPGVLHFGSISLLLLTLFALFCLCWGVSWALFLFLFHLSYITLSFILFVYRCAFVLPFTPMCPFWLISFFFLLILILCHLSLILVFFSSIYYSPYPVLR